MNDAKSMRVLMICGLLCGLFAATAMSGSVPQNKLIPLLAGSPQQGTLQTRYLAIAYNYTFSQNQLTVSGKLSFDDSLTSNYPGLRQFYMEVVLLDGQGGVLERTNVTLQTGYTWGDMENAAASSFNAQINVPPQTAAMTFYYNGATQTSRDGGMGTSFWFDPSSGVNP
jgi:hypothetical protein